MQVSYITDEQGHHLQICQQIVVIILRMLTSRMKRIDKTYLPNRTKQGQKYAETQFSYFYRVKPCNEVLTQGITNNNSFTKQSSFQHSLKGSQQRNRAKADSKRNQKDIALQVHKVKTNQRRNKSALSANFKQEDDFELQNITKIINGTNLGALSQLQIIKRIDKQQSERDKNQTGFPKQLVPTKRVDSEEDAAVSALPHKRAAPKNLRLRSRRSSVNEVSNWNDNKTIKFILGGEDFLTKFKESQMALMQKIPFYRQKKMTIDYKNDWKL